jgi:hypothetical protein
MRHTPLSEESLLLHILSVIEKTLTNNNKHNGDNKNEDTNNAGDTDCNHPLC